MDRLRGLSLFSGIGGIDLALAPWMRTVAYCEVDRYCQGVLLSRMQDGQLDRAPIWDDVRTLGAALLPELDIIFGGFPCQDLSCAGNGAGLAGERSGLFFEVERLAREIRPRFVYLENVPAIRTRGADVVVGRLAGLGYDCRWGVLSAFDVGAPHLRERWWLLGFLADSIEQGPVGGVSGRTASQSGGVGLLAHRHRHRLEVESQRDGEKPAERGALWHDADGLRDDVPDPKRGPVRLQRRGGHGPQGQGETGAGDDGAAGALADAASVGRREGRPEPAGEQGRFGLASCGPLGDARFAGLEVGEGVARDDGAEQPAAFGAGWWLAEPDVGRVVARLPRRVDRLRALGNAVVPACAREAFVRLSGLKYPNESDR